MERYIEIVAEIVEVDTNTLALDTAFEDIPEWDSMLTLTLVMELEAEYGISIPMECLNGITTLGDMYALVERK